MSADDHPRGPLSGTTVTRIRAVLDRYERGRLTLAAAIAEIEDLADLDRTGRP